MFSSFLPKSPSRGHLALRRRSEALSFIELLFLPRILLVRLLLLLLGFLLDHEYTDLGSLFGAHSQFVA